MSVTTTKLFEIGLEIKAGYASGSGLACLDECRRLKLSDRTTGIYFPGTYFTVEVSEGFARLHPQWFANHHTFRAHSTPNQLVKLLVPDDFVDGKLVLSGLRITEIVTSEFHQGYSQN